MEVSHSAEIVQTLRSIVIAGQNTGQSPRLGAQQQQLQATDFFSCCSLRTLIAVQMVMTPGYIYIWHWHWCCSL